MTRDERLRQLKDLINRSAAEEESMFPWKFAITAGSILFLLLCGGLLYGCPKYGVWQQQLKGEAELKRAEQNRHVKVYEAQAELEASTLKAQAEVERAKGVAQANAIIADGLKNNEAYLRYLWIDKVAQNASREIIYVPTEASIPILEANRLQAPPEAGAP